MTQVFLRHYFQYKSFRKFITGFWRNLDISLVLVLVVSLGQDLDNEGGDGLVHNLIVKVRY